MQPHGLQPTRLLCPWNFPGKNTGVGRHFLFILFLGRTDAAAEAPILWPPNAKNWLIWKDPDAGKDWRQKEKGTTEAEMIGWHNRLDGYEFEQTPGVGDGQGSLGGCSPWGCKESDTTEQLNWTELNSHFLLQGIFLTQGSISSLLHLLYWQADSLPLHHLGIP